MDFVMLLDGGGLSCYNEVMPGKDRAKREHDLQRELDY